MVKKTTKTIQNFIRKPNKSIAQAVANEDVQKVINSALGPMNRIISYTLKEFPGENLGFMAAHQNLVVTVYNEIVDQREDYTFFVKSMPYGIDSQVSLIEDARAFCKETTYYDKVLPELMASVKDNVWSAECFLVKDDKICSLKAALLALAKLHSASILTEKRLGKSLLKLYPNILKDRLYVREGKTYDWCLTGVRVAVAVAEHLKLDSTLIPQVCDRIYEAILPSKLKMNGICHGDTWSYNLLFDDSKPLPKCVMVDYQIIRYAPIMTDVSLLLYLTMEREFRESHESELLAYYHEVLCEKLQENDYQDQLPTLNDLHREYEQVRIVGIVTALLYFPIILLKGEESSGSTKSSDNYAKLQFRDRVSVVLDIMQRDLCYRKKIKAIVEETVQRAKYLLAMKNN